MAQEILVIGLSGTGKSTSLESLNPKETVIINPTKKALPFRGYKKNYTEFSTDNKDGNLFMLSTPTSVLQSLDHINKNMPHIKVVVLDDAGYIMSFEFFNRIKETGFQKFNEIGTNFANIIKKGSELRDDLTFIVMMHPEQDNDSLGNQVIKAKTVGRLVDNYLNIEGMFSIVLFSKVVKVKDGEVAYRFITQNDGSNTGKSPRGMFDKLEIPNDMKYVIDKIQQYNNG
jgi:hypothetical protein